MGILSRDLRERLLQFAEDSFGAGRLRVPVKEPRDFYVPCLAHALFAAELAQSESRGRFLPLFGKALDEALFTTIDQEAVERAHQPGVFLSEILVEWYTRPCVAAICAFVALRESMPRPAGRDTEAALARLVTFFASETAWGHGIERPGEVRDFVRLWAMAGCFPRTESPGYLPAFSGLRESLLEVASTPGWSEEIEPIRKEIKILLAFLRPEDESAIGGDACPAHALWVLKRTIPAGEILAMLEEDRLAFEADRFPWRAVSVNGSAEELGRFEALAEAALRRRDPQKVAALIKLDGLPCAIDRL
jgi:hypothetical protein